MNNIIVQSDTFGVTGSTWARIFHHNSAKGKLFNQKKALFSLEKDRFSLLKRLDDDFKHDGMFEFVLEYPQYSHILHWKQDKNPIYLNYNDDFNIEKLDSTSSYSSFYGLTLSKSSNTFLDGSSKDDVWHFAIGAYKSWPRENLFPGPRKNDNNYSFVNLYVRIWNATLLGKLSYRILCSVIRKSTVSHFMLLVFLLLA